MSQVGNDEIWPQIAALRPGLRDGVEVLVQDYRGERWYLLNDQTQGRFIRFNSVAYEFLGRLDGDLTVEEIIEIANNNQPGHTVLEPDDVLQVLAQLHGAEVLHGGLPLPVKDLLNRFHTTRKARRQRTLSNPLALRIPLFDPDRLLRRILPAARWIFTGTGAIIWLAVVLAATVLALVNSGELASAIGAKTLSTNEVLMFWLLYPVIKALHELGHGLAVKVWGGEVHETGISLLVFMPVPYVDASAAWAFRNKRRRAVVGAAGILVELFLAAVAMFVWLAVEPGLVRELALNVMLIGGISTLLFNGNPLLKFDGYYVLQDLIEIPSLATRSSRYYLYLIQRYLLGLADARPPVTARGEVAWFSVYGALAPLYRLGIMVGIAFYLAAEFLVVGIVLASWAVFMQLIRPLLLSIRFVLTSPRLEARRIRGLGVLASTVGLAVLVLSLPAPLVTRVQGVIWPDVQAQIVSPMDGFVVEVLAQSGEEVGAGDILLQLADRQLQTRRDVAVARLQELSSERMAQQANNRVRASIIADDIAAAQAELDRLDEQLSGMVVRSAVGGRFFASDPHDVKGTWIGKGDVLGYVIRPESPRVRAVIDQNRVGLLRDGATQAEVMLADRLGEVVPARIMREVPAGSEQLPSNALGAAGGGDIAVDLDEKNGRKATQKVFQIELALPPGTRVSGIGGLAHVRLEHGNESLLRQWGRSIRQLILSRLQT